MIVGMPHPRSYTDDELREAVANSTCWADAMEFLGKKRNGKVSDVQAVAVRLGLEFSHFSYARSRTPVAAHPIPFTATPNPGGKSGLSVAAQWFLDRGYVVSVPLEPAQYDLVTESDDGLKKIQIKTTRKVSKGGRFAVQLTRTLYDPALTANAGGKYRQVKYDAGMVDYFFIITAGGPRYLIPFAAVPESVSLVLDDKYRAFVVD